MTERIKKGGRDYYFRGRARRGDVSGGRRLSTREAIAFIRSLHSSQEQSTLRRVAFTSRGRHRLTASQQAIANLEAGRLEVWVLDARGGGGSRPTPTEPGESEDGPPPIAPPDTHTVVIELVDAEDNPVPFEPYRIKLPGGRLQTRALDKHGRDRITGIAEAGTCQVCFHKRDASVWAPA